MRIVDGRGPCCGDDGDKEFQKHKDAYNPGFSVSWPISWMKVAIAGFRWALLGDRYQIRT